MQPCRRCKEVGADCQYTDRTRSRVYNPAQVDRLERKIRRLEAQNRILSDQLNQQPSQSSASVSSNVSHVNDASDTHRAGPSDVIREVSYLSINAAGERHYLGSSSGVLLANFIKANVEVGEPSQPASPHARHDPLVSTNSADDAVSQDLPPESVAKKLLLAYLNHDHLCYPIVQPAVLRALLTRIYDNDGSFYTHHAHEAFMFDMILAIATTSISKSAWHVLPSAQSHYTRAMRRVSRILELGGLGGLQAIILLIQYRMSSSMQDGSASTNRPSVPRWTKRLTRDLVRYVASCWHRHSNSSRARSASRVSLPNYTARGTRPRPTAT